MAGGQFIFAFTHDIRIAFAARILIGAGDAMMFISVLRLVALWFPTRRVPLVQQLSGIIGQSGAIVAAVPLVALLGLAGWTSTFALAAALGVFATVIVIALVRDAPPDAPPEHTTPPPGLAAVRHQLGKAWREPGTRLGLWTHFATQFSGTTFVLLWGYPFLVDGEGFSPATAGLLLTLLTLTGMVFGPTFAHLVTRHPFHRSRLVLTIVGVTAALWTVVLLWPGRAPLWLVVVLVMTLATNGPGSMIAFDYARTFNPPSRIGSASGIANIGGFTATVITVLAIGAVLDFRVGGGSTDYQLTDFRVAFAVQYLVWAFGALQVWRYRRQARRKLADEDPDGFAALRTHGVVPAPH
jgi:cyanate permease